MFDKMSPETGAADSMTRQDVIIDAFKGLRREGYTVEDARKALALLGATGNELAPAVLVSELTTSLPKPVKRDSRICFGIAYFTTEADADVYAKDVQRRGRTYNGGYSHGTPCGRETRRDYVDPEFGPLYGVTE